MKFKSGEFVYYIGGLPKSKENISELGRLIIGEKYYIECLDTAGALSESEGHCIGLSCNKIWLHSSHFSHSCALKGDLVKISRVSEEIIGEVEEVSQYGITVKGIVYPIDSQVEILATKNII